MTKKEIAIAMSKGDFQPCFDFLNENTIWNIIGEMKIHGKDDIITHCKKVKTYFESITTQFEFLNIIENDSRIAINGTAEFIREGKRVSFISSCDVYEFDEAGNVNSITSYCITERPEK